MPSPPRFHGVGVFCPFGTGEPIRSTGAAGKSWHSWRPTHVVIASYVELENTDKTPVAVRSDTDWGHFDCALCVALCLGGVVKLGVKFLWSICFLPCRGQVLQQLWGQAETPAAGIFLFPEEKNPSHC